MSAEEMSKWSLPSHWAQVAHAKVPERKHLIA